MNPIRRAVVWSLTFTLVACGSSEPPPAPPAPPPEQDGALDRAIQAPLDKARAVEDEMKKARREQDAKIEEQGG